MPYKDLYEFAQGLEPVVSRNAIRDKILELTGASGFRFFVDHKLDPEVLCGYYVSPSDPDSSFARQANGKHVVVFSRGLNRCWERFVTVKEMMHLFDKDLEKTNTESDFESILVGFYGTDVAGELSPQMVSEVKCIWMALGVLCPEHLRVELQVRRDAAELSDLEIATQLRVPERYVPWFFHPRYKAAMMRLTSD